MPALTQKTDQQQHQHQITIHQHLQPSCKLTTSSVSVNRVFQVERAVCSSLVCLCHGSVYCVITSVPDELEVCQHARGSSRCSSRCPESPDIVPLCQMAAVPVSQDCTHGSVFVCNDDIDWFLSHVMAYWLCLSPFIVSLMYSLFYSLIRLCFIMEDNVYSLCLAFSNCAFINHTVPDK